MKYAAHRGRAMATYAGARCVIGCRLRALWGRSLSFRRKRPHKFVNIGEGPLRQIDIHASKRFITEWLED